MLLHLLIRSCVLLEVSESDDKTMTPQRLKAYSQVMSVGSARSKWTRLGSAVMVLLPSPVKNAVEKWCSGSASEFPPVCAWVGGCILFSFLIKENVASDVSQLILSCMVVAGRSFSCHAIVLQNILLVLLCYLLWNFQISFPIHCSP